MIVPAADNFRENLRIAITAQELTQKEVAVKAEMSQPYVNRVLQGKTTPSIEQCERLAKAVGFTLITLLEHPETFSSHVLTTNT